MIPNILNQAWGLSGDKLRQMVSLSRSMDLSAAETQDTGEAFSFDQVGSTAVIPVQGILTKDRTIFSQIFGGSSMREIRQAVNAAVADTGVKGIVLLIDSAGGTIDGTHELAQQIRQVRGKKPIVALADGTMLSSAYWIGSAADSIFLSGPTVEIGGVGVVATHVDFSERDKMAGEQYTEITAGKFKRISSAHRPLSDEGRASIQERVDGIYRIMVESIADLRGVSIPRVLGMADGKIYTGQAALDIGMADGIATLAEVVNKIGSGHTPERVQVSFEKFVYDLCAAGKPQHDSFREVKTMHPALFADFERRLKLNQVDPLFPGQR